MQLLILLRLRLVVKKITHRLQVQYSFSNHTMKFFVFLLLYVATTIEAFGNKKNVIYKEGKVMLGGLFPLHGKSSDKKGVCGGDIDLGAIQLAEGMLFAIDQINKDTNLSLGAYIRDSCSSIEQAIHEVVEFTDVFNRYKTNKIKKESGMAVRSVIIVDNPSTMIPVTDFLSNFNLAQIASRPVPDRSERYPNLVDMETSTKSQGAVLGNMAKSLDIKEIAIITSQSQNTTTGFADFLNETEGTIMLLSNETIPVVPTDNCYKHILKRTWNAMKQNCTVNCTVVLLMEGYEAREILNAATELVRRGELDEGKFIWLGSDDWGAKQYVISGNEKVSLGSVTFETVHPQNEEFSKYLHNRSMKSSNDCWHCPYLKDLERCNKPSGIL